MFLGACSSIPKTSLLPTNVTSVEQAEAWELKGKLLVKTPQDKFSTNLFWLHEPNRDQLTLTTMLGTTVLSLDAQPNNVTLKVDGKTHQGSDAQTLLVSVDWLVDTHRAIPLLDNGSGCPKRFD